MREMSEPYISSQIERGRHLFEVRAVITVGQPGWLSIRNFAQFSGYAPVNHTLLAIDDTNLETGVLRAENYFMSMKAVKSFSCVLTGYIEIYAAS